MPGGSRKSRLALFATAAAVAATTADGKLVGFEVDLAQALCRRMRVRCTIVEDWTDILPGLRQGWYDTVMAGVTVTAERAEVLDFSRAYTADQTRAACRLSCHPGRR